MFDTESGRCQAPFVPRRTAEQAEQTRRAILANGVQHFAEHGYGGGALADLLTSLGVTRGALYHHFGSKQGLFEAVVEHVQHGLSEKIARASQQAGGGWEGIEAGCLAFVSAATDPAYRRIVLLDAPAVLGWLRWKEIDDAHLTSSLHDGLRLAAEQAGVSIDAQAIAVALSGAMNELALWVAHHEKTRAPLQRARATIAALLRVARQGDVEA